VLVWSESMAPGGLNPEYMEMLGRNTRKEVVEEFKNMQAFKARITKLLGELNCSFLTGSSTLHYDPSENEGALVRRNSALWFDKSGKVVDQYAKIKLVPFSEYVPFKQGWPWLHGVLRGAVPEEMPQLQPGKEWTRFKLVGESKEWILGSPICFEGTFPSVCREIVTHEGQKVTDILLNISNDGWFVWQYSGGPPHDSSEHAQHLAQYHFRAVENRVPVVRCVNTGISASIDSNGREVARIHYSGVTMLPGAMLLGAGETKTTDPDAKIGYQIGPRVLVDNRQSLYSIIGDVFAWIILAAAIVLTGLGVWPRGANEKG
jgi:apolipoprotein N-acyltransferase